MTPEQLEAHRVRFEQLYADFRKWPKQAVLARRNCFSDTYDHPEIDTAWQAYQWALADADRAQRAVPGVQASYPSSSREVIEMLIACHEEPTCPAIDVARQFLCDTAQQPVPAQPPQQSVQPSMQDALAAGDGTLHGAIDYWQAKCAELEAKLAQSAQPGGEAVKLVDALLLEAEIFWWNDGPEGKSSDAMKAARDQVIVALSAAAQPVEVPSVDVDFLRGIVSALRGQYAAAMQYAYSPSCAPYKSHMQNVAELNTALDACFDQIACLPQRAAQPVEVQRVPPRLVCRSDLPVHGAVIVDRDIREWAVRCELYLFFSVGHWHVMQGDKWMSAGYKTPEEALKACAESGELDGTKPASSEGGA